MTDSKTIKKVLDTTAPVIDDGTVMRIIVPLDRADEKKEYTFAAVYVAGKWHLTGRDSLLASTYDTTIALMTAISRYPGTRVALAAAWESVRD